MVLVLRQMAKKTSLKMRAYSTNIKMKRRLKRRRIQFLGVAILCKLIRMGRLRNLSMFKRRSLCRLLKCVAVDVLRLTFIPPRQITALTLGPVIRLNRSVMSFPDDFLREKTRFNRNEISRMINCFRVPHTITLPNRSKVGAEESFLALLIYFAKGCSFKDIVYFLGREYTVWVRSTHWWIRHLIVNFAYKLGNNLNYWSQYYLGFAECIRKKMISLANDLGLPYDCGAGLQRVAFTFDCCCVQGTRTGGGYGLRQRAFFNNWNRIHGTKWATVEAPNGMSMQVFGPSSLRRNDNFLIADGNLNDRLAHSQRQWINTYIAYGDRAFPHNTFIIR